MFYLKSDNWTSDDACGFNHQFASRSRDRGRFGSSDPFLTSDPGIDRKLIFLSLDSSATIIEISRDISSLLVESILICSQCLHEVRMIVGGHWSTIVYMLGDMIIFEERWHLSIVLDQSSSIIIEFLSFQTGDAGRKVLSLRDLCLTWSSGLVGILADNLTLFGTLLEVEEIVIAALEIHLRDLLGIELSRIGSNDGIQVSVHCLLRDRTLGYSRFWSHSFLHVLASSTRSMACILQIEKLSLLIQIV